MLGNYQAFWWESASLQFRIRGHYLGWLVLTASQITVVCNFNWSIKSIICNKILSIFSSKLICVGIPVECDMFLVGSVVTNFFKFWSKLAFSKMNRFENVCFLLCIQNDFNQSAWYTIVANNNKNIPSKKSRFFLLSYIVPYHNSNTFFHVWIFLATCKVWWEYPKSC